MSQSQSDPLTYDQACRRAHDLARQSGRTACVTRPKRGDFTVLLLDDFKSDGQTNLIYVAWVQRREAA